MPRGFYSFFVSFAYCSGKEETPQVKDGSWQLLLEGSQEYLLYCNAQVYARAERIQGEGMSPSVLPTLEMRLPRGLTP